MKNEITALEKLLTDCGAVYCDEFSENILKFSEIFIETSKHLNLTAIKEPHDIMIKHYYDSLYPLSTGMFKKDCRVIDIGCGGGFPSMPLKIARPDLDFLLLDSLKKRLTFLDGAIAELGLDKISTLHARAEEASRREELRDSFDIAVSRAVAPLNVLCEYCLPFVKVNGLFIAYKGIPDDEEMEAAMGAIQKLSGRAEAMITYKLPEDMGERTLVVIRKVAPTHPMYPRSTKNMAKSPLS
ncbi:MAG: 16S rRNA (guanine(527)-N(7))-methyltransferase RsmG [Clostridia bacterium]|nr:16S rRNA (guanine(527)-N(7))-methyltransferase RsmG [Clostridia bacterium]